MYIIPLSLISTPFCLSSNKLPSSTKNALSIIHNPACCFHLFFKEFFSKNRHIYDKNYRTNRQQKRKMNFQCNNWLLHLSRH